MVSLLLLTSATIHAATITGFVWDDLNTNGIQDAGEPGRDTAVVLLLDINGNQVDVRFTDANGNFSFNNITPGTYILRFSNPGGLWQTLQDQGTDDTVDSDADPLGLTAPFTITDGQVLDFDAGFTTVPQGCFTPISVTVSAIACDDNGTPDPNDDTFTFAITATGGTGSWGWDFLPDVSMIPYNTTYTFGPFQIVDGVVSFTINDHDNPACTATVTVNPPMPCSTPLPPDTTTLSLICPSDITVNTAQGRSDTLIVFSNPTATTTCPGGMVTLTQTLGPASGDTFPVGVTDVCFLATDTCGNTATCCFKVTVVQSPSTPTPCNTQTIGCIKYELLDITLDANKNRTYRIRVTNNCTNKLIYTAFQLPNGITAIAPPNNSVYTAPSGREYLVRNPNFSPFYSIRFKSVVDSISSGQSDIFQYTLPPQSNPAYIHVIVRVSPKIFYEAYLSTLGCVQTSMTSTGPSKPKTNFDGDILNRESGASDWTLQKNTAETPLRIYPNPSAGFVFADLSAWEGQMVKVSLLNSHGRLVEVISTEASTAPFELDAPAILPNGLYFIEVITAQGERQVQRFVIQR